MPHLNEHHATWIGRVLTDASGHRIGRIDDIYTDDDTGQPEWLAIATGRAGPHTRFVPVRGATVSGAGVQVPFPREQVKQAPSSGVNGTLSRLEKGRLYAHYGRTHVEEQNRLQRSLGFYPPPPDRPAEEGATGRALALCSGRGPADVRDVPRPPDRLGTAELLPPTSPAGGRGRWPDDDAIFDLIPGSPG
ncbi:MAG: PRC-barrel domain-containing protein [Acidimicrobiales bacterium]